jgi:hypothetical protein
MSNDSKHEDVVSVDIQGTINGAGGSAPDVEPPSADFLASVHTVKVDQGDHREKRSLNFYKAGTDRKLRPSDIPEENGHVALPKKELERRGADPDQVFTTNIRADANLDAPAGSTGVFEKTGPGRIRFLGTMEELGGEYAPPGD